MKRVILAFDSFKGCASSPAIVVIDSEGNNLYETAVKEYAEE